ncbi:MAG: hybrid sensor histidine kinase/response regulator [Alphaproteobacteria bacterium]
MDDLIIEFIAETNESLEELDLDLVNLEQNPNDKDLLSKIFRLMHTIKGTCGFLALPRLEKVAHHAENVLGRFRDGDLDVTPGYVTLIFESIDQIKFIVGEIEETGAEPEGSDADLIARLDAAYEGKEVSGDASAVGSSSPEPATTETKDDDLDIQIIEKSADDLPPGEVSIEELEAAFAAAPGMDGIVNPADQEEEEQETTALPPIPKKEKNETVQKQARKKAVQTTQSLRVNVDVLENLMTMVSELVLTRNQLLQIVRAHGETEFSAPLQRLNHVVSDLQEGVMKTRMQPIGNAWSKLPRIIRDLSIELSKKIELEMKGQDTELDRQVLEMIKDPLTHMVRNSGDHGIENPDERIAAGKSETGKIVLEAYHEGGHIIIKISDDGKGLSEEKIKNKIIANGLATPEELKEMSAQQVQQFIFKAGFSTAEAVTAVSGRGVGMDVVRTNIEKIGGSIELKSVEGQGSTFTIKIPLTLAIVSALIVEASSERFAIPQLAVRELVMVSQHGDNRIEYIKGSPVFRLRDRLLPLISLSKILGLGGDPSKDLRQKDKSNEISEELNADAGDSDNTTTSPVQTMSLEDSKRDNLYIVIAQVGGYEFGIIVDRVFDTEEIVVKPVAQILKHLDLFSGNTILGDGSVIMILDPNGIANATGSIDTSENKDAEHAIGSLKPDTEKKTPLLLFNTGDNTRKAVPLSLVSRLENVKFENIEYSSGQMMVQYRGSLMPLIPFNSSVQVGADAEKPVLVFADNVQSMGIIVEEIVDIVEEHINVQLSSTQGGLLGSAIIHEQATDVVDIAFFLNNINRDWFKDHDDTPFSMDEDVTNNTQGKKRVLLVDDSPFFRNMLTPLLSVAGYAVTTMECPIDALKLCEDGHTFDAIISDIEMPDMNGFQFAQHVKHETSKWCDTPMIALSSHATPQDIEHGMKVGFNNYVAKFDKDTLLNTLSQALAAH